MATKKPEPQPDEHEVATGHPEPEEFSPPAGGGAAGQPRQQLTFGEKAVGLTFNPSGDHLVHALKSRFAQIIDLCDEERKKVNQGRITTGPPVEAARLWSIAITEAQGAQMWAVKAATWKD